MIIIITILLLISVAIIFYQLGHIRGYAEGLTEIHYGGIENNHDAYFHGVNERYTITAEEAIEKFNKANKKFK